jgi:hypothetical protein
VLEAFDQAWPPKQGRRMDVRERHLQARAQNLKVPLELTQEQEDRAAMQRR